MAEVTKIQWCVHTFNPWRGCTKVSPGCAHCYAEKQSKRNPSVLGVWGDNGTRVVAAESYWRQPLKWNAEAAKAGERRRVFCASLADVFEDRPELMEPRARLFGIINETPRLDWLLLTKRPGHIPAIMERHFPGYGLEWFRDSKNVWLGTSVEDQQRAGERIPHLLATPAAVRFLSCEPLLGPLELTDASVTGMLGGYLMRGIDWAIVGGESGAHSRPCNLSWVRSLMRQCEDAGAACFVKQLGNNPIPEIDGDRDWLAEFYPWGASKWGDPDQWPEDLRVREFPR